MIERSILDHSLDINTVLPRGFGWSLSQSTPVLNNFILYRNFNKDSLQTYLALIYFTKHDLRTGCCVRPPSSEGSKDWSRFHKLPSAIPHPSYLDW